MSRTMTVHRLPKTRSVRIPVTTTGSAGSATGSAVSPAIVGQILSVQLDFHASAPATTDVTVEMTTSGVDILATTNTVTDTIKVPSLYGVSNANAALSGDVTPQRYCVADTITVSVAQADALTNCVTAIVTYRPLFAEKIAVTTTGSAGSATGSTTSNPIRGEVLGILADFNASAPGTTDITVEMATTGIDLWARSNSVADAFAVPVLYSVDAANTALTSDVTPRHYCVSDRVTVSLAQSDALTDAVVVTVFWAPLEVVRIAVTTTGSAGSATGSATAQVEGEIVGLAANFHASAPGTTDVTVEFASGVDIWARSNSVADAFIVPGAFGVTNANGALVSNVTPEFLSGHEPVTASLAQCDALTDAVVVDLFVRR